MCSCAGLFVLARDTCWPSLALTVINNLINIKECVLFFRPADKSWATWREIEGGGGSCHTETVRGSYVAMYHSQQTHL